MQFRYKGKTAIDKQKRNTIAGILFLLMSILAILIVSNLLLISPKAQAQNVVTMTEFPLPASNSHPSGMTNGPDGNIWFTETVGSRIGKITPGGTITEYTTTFLGSYPTGIASGSDGNLWFTENTANKIGKITTSGVITEYVLPTTNSGPSGITSGPDGNLWFAEFNANKIGKITTSGTVTEYSIPTTTSNPEGISKGPDGNVWFTENGVNKIGKITTNGTVTEYAISTGNTLPTGITSGPDGNIWFTEYGGNKIGKITTSGTVSEYLIPTSSAYAYAITSGPDGNLWFTEGNPSKIGQITTSGVITEYAVPTSNSGPSGIASGTDGNVWFAEVNGNQIGRVNLTGPSLTPSPSTSPTPTPTNTPTPTPTNTPTPTPTPTPPPGENHYYVSAIKDYNLLSLQTGMVGRFTINQPKVPALANAYSIAQISASSPVSKSDTLELGWIVYPYTRIPGVSYGDPYPHLFVFTRHDDGTTVHYCSVFKDTTTGIWMCHDQYGNNTKTDFVPLSGAPKLPGDKLATNTTPQQFFVAHTNGRWYIGFQGTLIGYFPDTHWGGSLAFPGIMESQWYGEVVSPNTSPIEQMGNGVCGSKSGAAKFSNIQKIASFTVNTNNTFSWKTGNITPTLYDFTPKWYNYGHNSLTTNGYTFTYGGSGINSKCQ